MKNLFLIFNSSKNDLKIELSNCLSFFFDKRVLDVEPADDRVRDEIVGFLYSYLPRGSISTYLIK